MSDIPKVYRVCVEFETYVLARSAREAEKLATQDRDLLGSLDDVASAHAIEASRSMVDADWLNSLPWVADDVDDDEITDMTVGELLSKDELGRKQAEFDAKQLTLPGTDGTEAGP